MATRRASPTGATPGASSRRASPNSARAIAAEVVAKVLDDGGFVGPTLDAALRKSRLEARDKSLCTELVYGTLRWATPLEDALLNGATKPGRGLDKRIRPHLLVAAYQLQHLDERVPAHAAVSEAMKLIAVARPGLKGFANALLRKLGPALHKELATDAPLSVVARAFGVQESLAEATVDGLHPSDFVLAIASLNDRPQLSLAVLDDDVDDVVAQLRNADVEVRPHPFVPRMLLAERAGAPERLPGFDQGRFVVQDAGSRLVALLAAPKRGALVVDLCAAPGTKTIELAHAVGIRGSVVAVDLSARRLALVEEGAKRAAPPPAAPIRIEVADARAFAQEKERQGSFDVVLLDAPCSSLGTTRRHPEVCLRRTDADVAANAKLQAELLAAAADLVTVGGTLVYAVCSPMPDEGNDQIERFLRSQGGAFSAIPARSVLPFLPVSAVDARGAIRLRTHLHEADAFYAIRLLRTAPSSQ